MFRRKFFLSCRMAILAILVSCLFLLACPGEDEDQCFGPSGPVECMDIQYPDKGKDVDGSTDEAVDGTADNGTDPLESETETELSQNPCEGYEWLNGMEFYCEGFVEPNCTMEVAPVGDKCGFKCPDFWKFLDQLEIYPPPNVKIIVDNGGTLHTCTPTSQ